MAGAFLAALALRLLYLAAFRSSPFFEHLIVDGAWHDQWAWAWARGTWSMDGQAFFRAPLYPFWLSLIYRVFGHDLAAVRVIQAVVGAGTAAALAGAGHRLGGRTAGWTAGLLTALYGPLVFFDAELLIPNLLLALLAWMLFALAGRPSLRNALVAGALLGLAAVARPNALALLPAAGVWVAWRDRIPGMAGRGLRFGRAGALAGLALLPALVVTGINLAAEGSAVFISSQGGVNFYAGNHPGADGRSVDIPELGPMVSWKEFTQSAERVAEASAGRPLNSGQVSGWWMGRGLRWLREHPGDAAELYLKKLYYLLNAFEIPNNRDLYFGRPGVLRVLVVKTPWLVIPWGLVFPVAVAGAVAAWRDRRRRGVAVLLTGWFVLYGISLLPFFETARFRLPMVLPLVVLAGLAVARPRRAFTGWALAAGLAALVLANSNLVQARVENPGLEMARVGEAMIHGDRLEEGTQLLERAHRRLPRDVAVANLLAEAYSRQGREEDALALYREVARARPEDADARFNLGVSYLQLRRYEAAAVELREAVRLRPGDAGAWVNLGAAEEGAGRIGEAVRAYDRGITLGRTEPLGYLRLGLLFMQQGETRRAVQVLEAGVARIPDHFDLRYQLALVYAAADDPARALEQVDAALRLRPGDPQAVKLRQIVEQRLQGDPGKR